MTKWNTPPGPRGVLCHPSLDEWGALAAANGEAAAAWGFDVQGTSASRLREAARRRVLRLAGQTDPEAWRKPLFVTGHQPEFYHPGVWMKAFAAAEAAEKEGGAAVNFAVDHDAGELAAPIPRRLSPGDGKDGDGGAGPVAADDELHVHVRRLAAGLSGRPFEQLPAPTEADAAAFVREVDDDLATLGLPELRERFRVFADGLEDVLRQGARHGGEVGWRSRAAYERAFGKEPVPDVPLSAVCQGPEFLTFFVHWVVHAEPFLLAYNRALARVREARRIRSSANPFPDLLRRPDGALELPFWGITKGGIRRKLYVRREGERLVLSHLEGDYVSLPARGGSAAVEALQEAAVAVRPRAVPLTVFVRLFVADVFIHGTGGARYDEVTDLFIQDVFGVKPPGFAVVSATVHLPFGLRPVQQTALQGLRHKLRDLRFNPQRYAWEIAPADTEEAQRLGALVRKKEQLIDDIRRTPKGVPPPGQPPGRGPSAKRVLTRAIESTNAELYALLDDVERHIRQQLAAWQRKARTAQEATRRTYPFFLYDPADMRTLLKNGGE